MSSQEKALELYNKFYLAIPSDEMGLTDEAARQCAIIAVDEILNLDYGSSEYYGILSSKEYWEQVKIEIEKL